MTTVEIRPDDAGPRRAGGPHFCRVVAATMAAAVMLLLPAGAAVAAVPGPQPTGPLRLTVEVTGSPAAPATSSPAPSTTPAGSPAANPPGPGGLPLTGRSIVSVIALGVALLTVGMITRRVGRRRAQNVGQLTRAGQTPPSSTGTIPPFGNRP